MVDMNVQIHSPVVDKCMRKSLRLRKNSSTWLEPRSPGLRYLYYSIGPGQDLYILIGLGSCVGLSM